MKRILLAGAAAACLSGNLHAAEGIEITPGKWRITTTSKIPMVPEPQVQTHEECITTREFSPQKMFNDDKSPCQITDVAIEGSTMTWNMSCDAPEGNGKMTSEAMMAVEGDALEGKMNATLEVGDQSMSYEMNWDGKRLGDCQ